MPKNTLVLIIANISNPFDIFFAKICVVVKRTPTKTTKYSIVNTPAALENIKNQNDKPAVTASDLNRGEDVCILNRIDEGH